MGVIALIIGLGFGLVAFADFLLLVRVQHQTFLTFEIHLIDVNNFIAGEPFVPQHGSLVLQGPG